MAIVVSLDVCGLMASRSRQLVRDGKPDAPRLLKEAILHGATHAALFGLYLVIMNSVAFLSAYAPMHWKDFDSGYNGLEAVRTCVLLVSMITVALIWNTYRRKIVDSIDDDTSDENILANSTRIDIQVLFIAARARLRNTRLATISMYLSVAVDMLAISALIRVYVPGSPDAANVRAGAEHVIPHLNFFNLPEWLQILFFMGIIFVVVSGLAYATGSVVILRELTRRPGTGLVLRVLEPFLVFWIMILAMDHLFGFGAAGPADFWEKMLYAGMTAMLLTALLIYHAGWSEIQAAVAASAIDQTALQPSRAKAISEAEWREFVRQTIGRALQVGTALVATIVVLAVLLVVTQRQAMQSGSGLAELFDLVSIVVGIVCLLYQFAPIRWLAKFELRTDRFLFSGLDRQGRVTRIGYRDVLSQRGTIVAAAAAFVILFYVHLNYWHFQLASSFRDEEAFIKPIGTLVLIISGVCVALQWREWRQLAAFDEPDDHGEVELFRASVSETLACLGLVLLAVQCLTRLV
ncbi:MAG: hypothetical protein ACKOQM_10130 [Novosphingobium sp.]